MDLLGSTGAIGAGMAFGPQAGIATATPFLARKLSKQPQFQTKAAQVAPAITERGMPDVLKRLLFQQTGNLGSRF